MTGGAHLPASLQLAHDSMLTKERKMKRGLNEGRKAAFSEGTLHVSKTQAPDVALENFPMLLNDTAETFSSATSGFE